MVQSLEVAAQLHVSPQTDTLKQQGLSLIYKPARQNRALKNIDHLKCPNNDAPRYHSLPLATPVSTTNTSLNTTLLSTEEVSIE